MLKRPVVLAAVLLSAFTLSAKQNFNPPRLLIRTICIDNRDCDTISAITARVVPLLGTDSQQGVLRVDDADPIEPCLKENSDREMARCIQRHLIGNSPVDAMV